MIDNAEQKRLKKEYKVIRGTYTVRVDDYIPFDVANATAKRFLKDCFGDGLEDHTVRGGWKERK
jgi:hypothetical protein